MILTRVSATLQHRGDLVLKLHPGSSGFPIWTRQVCTTFRGGGVGVGVNI